MEYLQPCPYEKEKRFSISKPYDGPPFKLKGMDGVDRVMTGEGMRTTVEQYDDETTARVRVAVLNHGLAKKVFQLDEQVDEGLWQEVEDYEVED